MALRNPRVFLAGLRSVYKSHTKNPGVSGTMHGSMRLIEAAGSDTRKNQRVSGPRVSFGAKGSRNGEIRKNDERRYWLEKKTKENYNPGKAWLNR